MFLCIQWSQIGRFWGGEREGSLYIGAQASDVIPDNPYPLTPCSIPHDKSLREESVECGLRKDCVVFGFVSYVLLVCSAYLLSQTYRLVVKHNPKHLRTVTTLVRFRFQQWAAWGLEPPPFSKPIYLKVDDAVLPMENSPWSVQ